MNARRLCCLCPASDSISKKVYPGLSPPERHWERGEGAHHCGDVRRISYTSVYGQIAADIPISGRFMTFPPISINSLSATIVPCKGLYRNAVLFRRVPVSASSWELKWRQKERKYVDGMTLPCGVCLPRSSSPNQSRLEPDLGSAEPYTERVWSPNSRKRHRNVNEATVVATCPSSLRSNLDLTV